MSQPQTPRFPSLRISLPVAALLALSLVGCGPTATSPAVPNALRVPGATPAQAPMPLTAQDPPHANTAAPAQAARPPLAGPTAPALPETPVVAASGASGGGSAAPQRAGAARILLPDGRELTLSGGDTVGLPAGLHGTISLFAPGRVPSTIELPDGLRALHPTSTANAPEPTGLAVIEGTTAPGATVGYHAPGRQAFAGAIADADGHFRLTVPLDGEETGVLVASDSQTPPSLALAELTLQMGATATVPPLALAAPTGTLDAPAAPDGWEPEGAWLSAVPTSATTPWRVPVGAGEAGQALQVPPMPGFSAVASFGAQRADGRQGALVSGAPGAMPAWLAAPDMSGIGLLGAGEAIAWPGIPGATLYTLKLTSPAHSGAVWEAACVTPRVVVPAGLAIDYPGLVLEVTAWDVPGVSVYSVASLGAPLRALRLPAGPGGLGGRMSWSRQAVGPSAK